MDILYFMPGFRVSVNLLYCTCRNRTFMLQGYGHLWLQRLYRAVAGLYRLHVVHSPAASASPVTFKQTLLG